MTIYQRMAEYARQHRVTPVEDLPAGELGKSLALFHQSLIETGLDADGTEENPRLTAMPEDISPLHLSYFVVAFLPFNAITEKSETNSTLFDVYSFCQWLRKTGAATGLEDRPVDGLIRELAAQQDRCLKLSHLLDAESERVLEFPPEIVSTRADLFRVTEIARGRVLLQSPRQEDTLTLRLSGATLEKMRPNDHLELVIGDTSERWVLLEASKVFPGISQNDLRN